MARQIMHVRVRESKVGQIEIMQKREKGLVVGGNADGKVEWDGLIGYRLME